MSDEYGSVPQEEENINFIPDKQPDAEIKKEAEEAWIPPDGGYGWLLVLACFLLWFEYGHITQSGIFMLRMTPEFNVTNTEFGGLNSVQGASGQLLGMFIGTLVERFGCRPVVFVATILISVGYLSSAFVKSFSVLYFTYGLLPSFAIGIFYCCAIVAANQYFVKRRALANAVALSGWNVSTFVWPPIGSRLTTLLGWRNTFLIEAAMHFVIGGIIVLLLRPPGKRNTFCIKQSPTDEDDLKEETCKEKLFQIVDFRPLTDTTLVVYVIGVFLFLVGHAINIVYIPVRSELLGITPETAAFHATVLGIVVSVVTLAFSPVGDLKQVNRGLVFTVGQFVAAVVTFISVMLSTSTHFYIYAAVLGLVQGIYLAVDIAFFVDVVDVVNVNVAGDDVLAAASGWYTVVCALSPLVLHPIVGVLLDKTGDPHSPFILAGAAQAIGSVLFAFVTWRLHVTKNEQTIIEQNKTSIPLDESSNYKQDK